MAHTTNMLDHGNAIPFNIISNFAHENESQYVKPGSDKHLIERYLRFCNLACIPPLNTKDSLKKMIIVSLREIDKVKLNNSCNFQDTHVYWEHVQSSTYNAMDESSNWLEIVEYLHLDSSKEYVSIEKRDDLNIIHEYHAILNKCGISLSVLDIYRLLILNNLNNITGMIITELFLNSKLQKNSHTSAVMFSGILSDCRFSKDEYLHNFAHILTVLDVQDSFFKEVEWNSARKKDLQEKFKIKHMQAMTGRLRLRDRQKEIRAKPDSQLNDSNIDTFDGWIQRVRFPNVVAHSLKLKCYLLCASTHSKVIEHVLSLCNHHELGTNVYNTVINNPDVSTLVEAIRSVSIYQDFFPQLYSFSKSCLNNFATRQRKELTPALLLHLYICAYQQPNVWKECWKSIYPVLSFAIIRDVEKFVQETPYNAEKIFQLIKNS